MSLFHILQGGIENGDQAWLIKAAKQGLTARRWIAPKSARTGDDAVIDAKPQAVHVERTAAVAPLQGAKLNPSLPGDITAAQNRLIKLGFLAGPADGVWGTKSRMALRAFKIANGLAADDKWDDLVSSRLYSAKAARSPLPPATTGR